MNRILITGATGYVGGRLRSRLEDGTHRVRCMARRPETIRARIGENSDVVAGDVLDPESLQEALQNVHTAYYLVHSMGAGPKFEALDREGAQNFARAAKSSRAKRSVSGTVSGPLARREVSVSPSMYS